MSGIADFADIKGLPILREWMDAGYSTLSSYDKSYSEWLGVRESIKLTTVKPSGTVSILAGESPGVHWTPGGKYFERTIRFAKDHPMLPLFQSAGYKMEPDKGAPLDTIVIYFPMKAKSLRSEKEVSIYEKASLAAIAQRYWSDNSVSVTVSFNPKTEGEAIGTILHMFDGQLKTISFLPMDNGSYAQMPYTRITEEDYEASTYKHMPIDFTDVYLGMDFEALGEKYCSSDRCVVELG